jgi:hypothetical protein
MPNQKEGDGIGRFSWRETTQSRNIVSQWKIGSVVSGGSCSTMAMSGGAAGVTARSGHRADKMCDASGSCSLHFLDGCIHFAHCAECREGILQAIGRICSHEHYLALKVKHPPLEVASAPTTTDPLARA